MKIEELGKKSVLILGFGKEGRDAFYFLRRIFPNKTVGVADINEKISESIKDSKVKFHLGKDYLKSLKKYQIIIKSPGIPIHLPEVERAFNEKKIISSTQIFFDNCPGKIIGITGTKGKSTTTYLIYKILKAGKIKAHLIGNIGKPPLKFLFSVKKNDVFVYELSCHQLYNLKKSPQIAVFLNIYPEHLDYYKNFKEYKKAKANIVLYQKENDYLIYNFNDKNVRKIAKRSKARKIPIKSTAIFLKKIGCKKSPLANFYRLNIASAIAVGEIFQVKKEILRKTIENFKGLPHRLEFVGKFKGIYFYNDSLSTIPETTISAIESLDKKIDTLILGGYDRGLSFESLAKKILEKKIKNLILFPETGRKIKNEILRQAYVKKFFPKMILATNMKEAVKNVFSITRKGKICLLSPASPSFGLFKNYKERGDLFKKFVKYYGKKS